MVCIEDSSTDRRTWPRGSQPWAGYVEGEKQSLSGKARAKSCRTMDYGKQPAHHGGNAHAEPACATLLHTVTCSMAGQSWPLFADTEAVGANHPHLPGLAPFQSCLLPVSGKPLNPRLESGSLGTADPGDHEGPILCPAGHSVALLAATHHCIFQRRHPEKLSSL